MRSGPLVRSFVLAASVPLCFCALVVSGMSTAACTKSPCAAQCAADPEPSAADRDRCENGAMPVDVPACREDYLRYRDCTAGLTVCTRDDRTDEGATTQAVLKECGPLLKTYTDCTSASR